MQIREISWIGYGFENAPAFDMWTAVLKLGETEIWFLKYFSDSMHLKDSMLYQIFLEIYVCKLSGEFGQPISQVRPV